MARPNLRITVFFKKEDNQVLAFAPTIDLSTAGRNLTEAKRNFERALDLFFQELEDMGTLDKALRELGWRHVQASPEPWRAPSKHVPTHLLARREFRVPIPA